jgi:L-histidine Nalpha-methyltransferase / hercynylcysteine S-oxide synthase
MPSSVDMPPVPSAALQNAQKGLVKMQTPAGSYKPPVDIIDVRRAVVDISLKDEVLSMFNPTNGPRQLPTLLLYDEQGLQLFEEVGCLSFQPHFA